MRTLERITVTGYKSIKELRDFELGDLNVLIGANGAGKSNFLSIFKLLNRIYFQKLQDFTAASGGAERFLHFGRKVTSQINLSFQASTFENHTDGLGGKGDLHQYAATLKPTVDNRLYFAEEEIASKIAPNDWGNKSFGTGHGESKAAFELLEPAPWFAVFDNEQVYHFQDTSEGARVKQNGYINDTMRLRPDASNLAAFLNGIQTDHRQWYKRIVDTIHLASPFIDDFYLHPYLENKTSIRLAWRHSGTGDLMDVSALSDGTLRFICLTTLLLQPKPPSLIIIDEPELGLHPYAINLLGAMLRSASEHSQIIISTQSVEMVNQFEPEEIIVVDRENDQSVFKKYSSQDLAVWLEDYSIGEIWQKNLIGGRPRR